jgi:predicted ATPase
MPTADIDAMVRAIFGVGRPIRFDFLDVIASLTDGNPFFIEETLKVLVNDGEIYLAGGSWNRKDLSTLRVPRSVQDAVRRRVEKTSKAAQQVIAIAAVAGRRFDVGLMQEMSHLNERELLALMKELVTAQIVVEESADRFAFRHALTRQAIYSGLLARERQALHRQVAEAIECRAGDQADAYSADLALHFAEAGDWQKTLLYARLAGDRAQAVYSPRAAVEHFTRALNAGAALKLPVQPKLLRARGQAFETLGEFERARADYQAALIASREVHERDREWQAPLLALHRRRWHRTLRRRLPRRRHALPAHRRHVGPADSRDRSPPLRLVGFDHADTLPDRERKPHKGQLVWPADG